MQNMKTQNSYHANILNMPVYNTYNNVTGVPYSLLHFCHSDPIVSTYIWTIDDMVFEF